MITHRAETEDYKRNHTAIAHPSTTRIRKCRKCSLQGPLCSIPVEVPRVALPTVYLAFAPEEGEYGAVDTKCPSPTSISGLPAVESEEPQRECCHPLPRDQPEQRGQ